MADSAGSVSTKEVPPGADWNEVEDAFLRRRSVRKFKDKQVPEHLIRRILEVARFSASQGNCQPWKFVVVRDRAMLDEMEQYVVGMCAMFREQIDYMSLEKGTPEREQRWNMAQMLQKEDPNKLHPIPFGAITLIGSGRFAVFHNAPTMILLLKDVRGVGCPDIDIGICGTSITLTAHSLGLGTCWVGFAQVLSQDPGWCERLGIKYPYELSQAIVVGYPVGDPTRNYVDRETHEIVWFDDGEKRIEY